MFVMQARNIGLKPKSYMELPKEAEVSPKPVVRQKSGLTQTIKKGEEIQASQTLSGIRTVSGYIWNKPDQNGMLLDYYNASIYYSKANDPVNVKCKLGVYFSPDDGAVVADIQNLQSAAFLKFTTKSGAITSLNPLDRDYNTVTMGSDTYTVLQRKIPQQQSQAKDAFMVLGIENDFSQSPLGADGKMVSCALKNQAGEWQDIFDVQLRGVDKKDVGGVTTYYATVEVFDRASGTSMGMFNIDKGGYALMDGEMDGEGNTRPKYLDAGGNPVAVYIQNARYNVNGAEMGDASIGIYTDVSVLKQGDRYTSKVVDADGNETGKSLNYTVNFGSDTGYKPSGNTIGLQPDAGEGLLLLPGERVRLGASSATLLNEGLNQRVLTEGSTSIESLSMNYATEDMPYLKAGTVKKLVIHLSAGKAALFHPIFDNASTKGGYTDIAFDPNEKKLYYKQENGLWLIKDLPNGLGMVAYGNMTIGIDENGTVTHDGMVRGDGKVMTLDANNMRLGESSNARPGMEMEQFVYTYATFKAVQGDYQFDSQLLYRGLGEADFGSYAAPYTTHRGDEIVSIDPHTMRWKYSNDITKSTNQVTLRYSPSEKPEHSEPVSVREEPRRMQQKAEKLAWPANQNLKIRYEIGPQADVRIYDLAGREMQDIYINKEADGFTIYGGALQAGDYVFTVSDGRRTGRGSFKLY